MQVSLGLFNYLHLKTISPQSFLSVLPSNFFFSPQMVDSNQRWEVQEAISWMQDLAEFNIYWIEEPTSPDDISGHLAISQVGTLMLCRSRSLYYFRAFFYLKKVLKKKNGLTSLSSIYQLLSRRCVTLHSMNFQQGRKK